jgi:Zn-dependent alcohol dehydrogenase
VQERKIQMEPMISRVVELDQIDQTFQELLDPGNQLVQVIVKCT